MWEDTLRQDDARRRIIWLIGIIAALALALGGWYWYSSHKPAATAVAESTAPAPAAVSSEPQIAHPLPAQEAAALPALNDSDQVVRDSLVGVTGRNPVEEFLVPQNIVRHTVATIDNLPQHKVAVDLRPIKPTPGTFAVSTQGDLTTLSDRNYVRYTPLVKAVEATDVKALAVVYEHLYPLFQQSYEDLGYPGKYFNDRLVQVIDDLLQAPEPTGPVQLIQPKVFYQYADPNLESRSAGQKLLIRMGPSNERAIKAKLREFRAEIVKKK
jgi:hypothetical protein